MYKTILLAVDLSPQSHAIAKKAKLFADQFQAQLHIVHVVEHSPLAYGDEFSLPIDVDLEQVIENEARTMLLNLCREVGVQDDDAHMASGSVQLIVHDLAKKLPADLIIVGSHGHHGIERLLGSRANALLHNSPCDTLAIRVAQ